MSRMNSKKKTADCDRVANGTSCLIYRSKQTSKEFCAGCFAYVKTDLESVSEVMRSKKTPLYHTEY